MKGGREGGKEGEREGEREGGRERQREGGRDGEREGGRDREEGEAINGAVKVGEHATALGERRPVLHRRFCQFIEPVTFARCVFIFALRNITLGGYLDTRRNI